ncbi:helix-turn-helix domain-containing protein [Roseovarius aestuarii]|nr:helix-turn-helix domain-containing protein [Roseovarius aestuarii]
MPSSASTIERSETVHQQARLLAGWQQTYSQIGMGPFSGSLSSTDRGTVRFFDEQMNREVLQTGGVPENKIGFGVPVKVGSKSYLCGESVDAGQLLVFSGSSGFEFLSPQNFRFYGIEIDVDGISDPKLAQMTSELRQMFAQSRRAITLNSEERFILTASLDAVNRRTMGLKSALVSADQSQIDALNRQMVGTVLDCLSRDVTSPVHGVKHWDIVTQIRDLVKSNPQCPRTVAELTVELGVSRRTLQNACRDILDVSPVQYLRSLRLSEVRQTIETASSVTDVATEYGFWHLSYFARDYRVMFGESPSKTLERYRRQ